ncbi:MAG: hypothetical protein Q8O56_06215 [Solirubrobacteraceae bacterium]|nr:hypothetical protein [Solirubrobacteraceae bacterium]
MTYDEARAKAHEAIGGLLDDDEIAVSWVLTVDVAGLDGHRYLAHRSGGGTDGSDDPVVWVALGMLRASVQVAENQLLDGTIDADDDDEVDE